MARLVIFDVLGTLFDLESVRARLIEIGAPELTLEDWFERLLHTALTLTTVGQFRPFQEIADSTLKTTFAQLELDASRRADVLDSLKAVAPYDDAEAALGSSRRRRHPDCRAQQRRREQTKAMLERAGLLERFERIFGVEEVGAYKPDARPYRHVLDEMELEASDAKLIAAHAWDVVGARAAGLRAIWVARLERRWPLPLPASEGTASLIEAATLASSVA